MDVVVEPSTGLPAILQKPSVQKESTLTTFTLAESDVCEMSACEVFVDYGDEPETDFDKICPEIKQEFNYKREYIVEYIEG